MQLHWLNEMKVIMKKYAQALVLLSFLGVSSRTPGNSRSQIASQTSYIAWILFAYVYGMYACVYVCSHVYMDMCTYVFLSHRCLIFWGRVSHLNQELSTLASLVSQLALGIPHRINRITGWLPHLHGFRVGSGDPDFGLEACMPSTSPFESSSQPSAVTFSSVSEIATKWTNRQMAYMPGWTYRTKRYPTCEGADYVRVRGVPQNGILFKAFEVFLQFSF